ncbi:MAG: hypothetical protein M1821_003718 [Bathelium mastoideum]|nr:MAG: hypothetical protein M1821_003718 [Bathelium mastoideum]
MSKQENTPAYGFFVQQLGQEEEDDDPSGELAGDYNDFNYPKYHVEDDDYALATPSLAGYSQTSGSTWTRQARPGRGGGGVALSDASNSRMPSRPESRVTTSSSVTSSPSVPYSPPIIPTDKSGKWPKVRTVKDRPDNSFWTESDDESAKPTGEDDDFDFLLS